MFKVGNFETELAQSMAQNLVQKHIEKKANFDGLMHQSKVSQAVDHLNKAAALFDELGQSREAELITKMLEKMAEEHEHKAHEHKKHEEPKKEEIPEMFEIESLLHKTPEEVEVPELGEQIIEFTPLSKKKV